MKAHRDARRDQTDRQGLAAVISSLEPFASCSGEEQRLICRLSTLTDVPSGAEVCSQSEPGLNFYVLVRGEAVVTIDARPVAKLGPGCGFGEIALLTPHGRRIASVTAAVPSRLVVVSRPEFATLMIEVPRFVAAVMASCQTRLPTDGPVVTS